MCTHAHRFTLFAALLGLALFAATLTTPGAAAQSDPTAPEGVIPFAGDFLVHVATEDNIALAGTFIDHPQLNGDPDAILFATQVLNPNGAPVGVLNNGEIGVAYSDVEDKWGIYIEHRNPMPLGAAFNVFIAPSTSLAYVHTTAPANIFNNWTRLSHPDASDDEALFLTIHNYNPGGGEGGEYHESPLGVWYDTDTWSIFNQDLVTMDEDVDFNVFIIPPSHVAMTHTATVDNIDDSRTFLDHPLLNGRPHAVAIVTQNWSLPSAGGVYNAQPIGLLYDVGVRRWAIFNESGAPMPVGAGFNLLIAPARNYLPLITVD